MPTSTSAHAVSVTIQRSTPATVVGWVAGLV
jgi:hypothetical protein